LLIFNKTVIITNMNKKFLIIILALFIAAVVLAAVLYIVSPESFQGLKKGGESPGLTPEKPKVIEEKLVIPETEKITGGEGRVVNQGPVEVPLVPKTESEKVAVSKAVLTVKGSYDLAVFEAKKWMDDASLVFVKSLGAVTLEGKSSQWQLVFSSETKADKGYEVIIQEGQIVSKKEIDSQASGADLPGIWKDSGEIIVSLQELPQFSSATISSINLYYNTDGKLWRYVLSTSRGNTSVSAE
jgi:hypothetical protein